MKNLFAKTSFICSRIIRLFLCKVCLANENIFLRIILLFLCKVCLGKGNLFFLKLYFPELPTQEILRFQKDFKKEKNSYIGNMSSVHNFTKDISQVVPRHLVILRQVVKQDISANSKITVIKVINSGPSLRAELFTSKHN